MANLNWDSLAYSAWYKPITAANQGPVSIIPKTNGKILAVGTKVEIEKALKKWERQSRHPIEVVQSNSDDLPIYRHGFSRPAPARARPRPVPREEGPVADAIPDLDDLSF